MWNPTTARASLMRAQNGSKTGSAILRPAAGPGRIDTIRAPRSRRPFQLVHGPVGIDQRQQGRGMDAPVPVETPLVVQPTVESGKVGVEQIGIVNHVVLHAHRQGGEQHCCFDALGVEHLHSG